MGDLVQRTYTMVTGDPEEQDQILRRDLQDQGFCTLASEPRIERYGSNDTKIDARYQAIESKGHIPNLTESGAEKAQMPVRTVQVTYHVNSDGRLVVEGHEILEETDDGIVIPKGAWPRIGQ